MRREVALSTLVCVTQSFSTQASPRQQRLCGTISQFLNQALSSDKVSVHMLERPFELMMCSLEIGDSVQWQAAVLSLPV